MCELGFVVCMGWIEECDDQTLAIVYALDQMNAMRCDESRSLACDLEWGWLIGSFGDRLGR